MKNIMTKIGFATAVVTAFAFAASFVAAPVSVSAAASCTPGTTNPLQAGVDCAKPSGAQDTLFGENSIFQTVANLLIFVVGIIAVIMLIIGGIRYAVSGGDQGAVTSAKNTILYAIIGLVIAFLAFAAVNWVISSLVAGAGK